MLSRHACNTREFPRVSFALFLCQFVWQLILGPRLLLPGLPGLCALTGLLAANWRKLPFSLFLLGFLVNALKLISFYERSYAELNEQGIATTRDMAWPARDAPFVHAWCAVL